MDFVKELTILELLTECYYASQECNVRIDQWNDALTKEEAESAEKWYYVAQERWSMLYDEIIRRGQKDSYNDYCIFVSSKGWK